MLHQRMEFSFQYSCVILGIVPSAKICWRKSKSYLYKDTFFLDVIHRFKNPWKPYQTSWWNIHFSYGNAFCPFYVDFFFLLPSKLLPDCNELLTIHEHLCSSLALKMVTNVKCVIIKNPILTFLNARYGDKSKIKNFPELNEFNSVTMIFQY